MNRKVNLVGQSTLTVSLPAKWARDHAIQKGDELSMIEDADSLVLSTGAAETHKRFSVTIDKGNNSYLRFIISNAYKKGYDEIEVKYVDVDLTPQIHAIATTLIGMEMLETDSTHCVIKNVASELNTELDSMLRKSFQLVIANFERTRLALKNAAFQEWDNVNNAKLLVTRYTDFCKRLLNKTRKDDTFVFRYLLIHMLEKLSNSVAYIYRYGIDAKPKEFSKDCIKFFEKTKDLFELFHHAYYSKDKAKIKEINIHKDAMLFDELYALRKKATPDDLVVIHYCAMIVRNCVDLTGPFFGILA